MTPHDWFTLFLRLLGVWELIGTVDQAITILNISAGVWRPERTTIGTYITHGLAAFLIGIWLLKAAPTIARAFYPAKPSDPNSK